MDAMAWRVGWTPSVIYTPQPGLLNQNVELPLFLKFVFWKLLLELWLKDLQQNDWQQTEDLNIKLLIGKMAFLILKY